MCNCYLCTRDNKQPLDHKQSLKRGIEVYNEIRPNEIKTAQDVAKFNEWYEKTGYNQQICFTVRYFIQREALFGYDTLDKLTSADLYATVPVKFGGKMPDDVFNKFVESQKELKYQ
jgi:hypothetical protein